MHKNIYTVNHNYNPINPWLSPLKTSTSSPSFREQIDKILTRWHQLQYQKQNFLHEKPSDTTKNSNTIVPCELIDFDRIMEEDLEYQLQELERQEEEQYQLLEQSLEIQLQQEETTMVMQDFEQEYVRLLEHIENLKKLKENEQQHQSTIVSKEKVNQLGFERNYHILYFYEIENIHVSIIIKRSKI